MSVMIHISQAISQANANGESSTDAQLTMALRVWQQRLDDASYPYHALAEEAVRILSIHSAYLRHPQDHLPLDQRYL